MAEHYDYIIVGAGLYGAMFAHKAIREGKSCLVIDRRSHIGGYCYTENVHGIEVHKFGAHIFRTNSKKVWDFVNSIADFIPFVNAPIARVGEKIYNLPFNMNTFNELWGVTTPEEAREKIKESAIPCEHPENLEQFVLSAVGREIYEKFIKGYTEKQWGRKCSELPVSTMSRVPIRLTYNNSYYNELYQGIPAEGYTEFINRLLRGADIRLGVNYLDDREALRRLGDTVIFTGAIDSYFDYCFGRLDYQAVGFQDVYHANTDNFQGNAVVNYPDAGVPYTRSIEHRHFVPTDVPGTIVTYEFPLGSYLNGGDPSYPILNERNREMYARYRELAEKEHGVIFGGRLGEYRYYAMNDIVEKFI